MSRQTAQQQSRRERRAQARLQPRQPRQPARNRRGGQRPMWQSPLVLTSAAALVVGAVLIFIALPKPTDPGRELQAAPLAYPAGQTRDDVIGSATAPVVVELYADFQCPACKLFVTTQLHRLVDDFVVPGTVRIEARDIAFLGRGSPDESLELAAGAACATEQDRYWTFHDLVFWNQGRENRGDHDATFIGNVADMAGVDRVAWDACFARADVRGPITSRTQAAIGQGIQSTPTLVINGQKVVGVPDYDQLSAMIRGLASQAPSQNP